MFDGLVPGLCFYIYSSSAGKRAFSVSAVGLLFVWLCKGSELECLQGCGLSAVSMRLLLDVLCQSGSSYIDTLFTVPVAMFAAAAFCPGVFAPTRPPYLSCTNGFVWAQPNFFMSPWV